MQKFRFLRLTLLAIFLAFPNFSSAYFDFCTAKTRCMDCVAVKSCAFILSNQKLICVSKSRLFRHKFVTMISTKSECTKDHYSLIYTTLKPPLPRIDNEGVIPFEKSNATPFFQPKEILPVFKISTVAPSLQGKVVAGANLKIPFPISTSRTTSRSQINNARERQTINPNMSYTPSLNPTSSISPISLTKAKQISHTTAKPNIIIHFPPPTIPSFLLSSNPQPSTKKTALISPSKILPLVIPAATSFFTDEAFKDEQEKKAKPDEINKAPLESLNGLFSIPMPSNFSCHFPDLKQRDDWRLWAKAEYYLCRAQECVNKLSQHHTLPITLHSWNNENVASSFQNNICIYLKWYKRSCGGRF